ncbi:MAG: STAS domain-containing protein [Planctomycetota bacterium]
MIQRVEVGRDLSHGAIGDLGATLSEQIGRGVTSLHLNTARVMSFDSQALESLVEFNELARARGLSFVIVDPSEPFAVALSITGLESRFEIRRGEPEAAAAKSGAG